MFNSSVNFTTQPAYYEFIDSDSLVVPGQSQTIPEILERFGAGIPATTRVVHYDDDPDLDLYDPHLRPDYDIVDAMYDLANLRDRINNPDTSPIPVEEPEAPPTPGNPAPAP